MPPTRLHANWQLNWVFTRLSYIIISCSVLEHEFETPRSKCDASHLRFDDPEWAPFTSPFSVDPPCALDLKLEMRAIASKSVEVPFAVRESTKVKEKRSRSDASQLASDDLEWAPLTSPFSVDSPLSLDLKVRASVSKLVDGFLSSYHSNKVDSKYSSLATRVRRPRTGTFNQALQCGYVPVLWISNSKRSETKLWRLSFRWKRNYTSSSSSYYEFL